MTGGRFGFDDRVAEFSDDKTSHAGRFIMVLDPIQTAGRNFFERAEEFSAQLKASVVERLPGDHRYSRRLRSVSEGIRVSIEHYETMMSLFQ